MQICRNRPRALFGCSVAVSSFFALSFSGGGKLTLVVLCLLIGAMAIPALVRGERLKKIGLYGLSCVLGISLALGSSYLFFDGCLKGVQKDIGKVSLLTGTVLSRGSSTSFSSSFYVLLDEMDGERTREKIVLECAYPSALQSGDRFEMRAYQRAFSEDRGYDEEKMSLSDGYVAIYVCDDYSDCNILPEKSRDLRVLFHQWNQRLSVRLSEAIGGEEGALATALLLGNRSFLSDDTTLHFRRVGVSHMLALSGLHVSILVGFLEFLLRKLRVAKQVRAFVMPPVLIGYLLLTGASESTLRAVCMVCILYLGFLLHSEYDSFTALCTVMATLLIVTPYAVLDLSMWLSFLAAASIIVFLPAIHEIGKQIKRSKHLPTVISRVLSWGFEVLMVGSVANAGLLLISSAVFGEASWMSVPVTILLSLPLSATLVLSVPILLFPNVPVLPFLCRSLSLVLLECTEKISRWQNLLLSINSKSEYIFLCVFTVLLIIMALVKLKRKIWILSIPLLTIAVFAFSVFTTNRQPLVVFGGDDETRFSISSEGGMLVVVNRSEEMASDAEALVHYAKVNRCAEIGDLILPEYHHKNTYLVHALSEKILIRRIRLPEPKDENEEALAARIQQEAEFHDIEVLYHTDALCVQASDNMIFKQETNQLIP